MSDIPSLAMQDVDWQGHAGRVVYNDRRIIEFYTGSKLHGIKSGEAGRPIHIPVTMLRVRQPGEAHPVDIEAREWHQYEFPRQWAAFQAGTKAEMEGTPMSILYPMDANTVRHMRSLHIYTVEQLAGLTEAAIQRLGMGGRGHVERAKEYLEVAKAGAGNHRLQAELDRANERSAAMEAQMRTMERQLQALTEAALNDPPRRRGRTPKAETGEPEDDDNG
jgi:hypothetical protein